MPVFPRPSSPRAALADLRTFVRHRRREQWIGLALAVLATLVIVVIFFLDSKVNTAPPKRVIYVESWSADRTDAEIIADQKKDQAQKEERARERQRQFQKLEKQLGL